VAKAAASMYCRSEALLKGLPVVTLRIFSPYGPWDDPSRFVPAVATALLRGKSPVLSSATSVRDYIFIEEIIDLYLLLIAGPVQPGAIYNAGSGQQRTLGEVAACLTGIIGNGVEPEWGARPLLRPEPASWVADMSAVAAAFGWQPSVSLQQGLGLTVNWLRNHLELYPERT
jgi:nucleoside-diphosphate-sugar epimerase